jgi:hypothetical protein
MRFFAERAETVRVLIKPMGDSIAFCELRHDFRARNGKLVEADRLCASGHVRLANSPMPIESLAVPEKALAAWRTVDYADEAAMWFGSGMRCLQRIQLNAESGCGEIAACPRPQQAEVNARPGRISPPVFDGCLVGCATYTHEMLQGKLQMPAVIDRIELGTRQLHADETGLLSFRFLGLEENQAVFQWTLSGNDNAVLIATTGYRCSLVSGRPGELLLGVRLG